MHDPRSNRWRMTLASLLLGAGCYQGTQGEPDVDGSAGQGDGSAADDDGSEGGDDDSGGDDGDGGVDAACGRDGELGTSPAPLRRLTAEQFRYTVDDLLGLGELADPALERLAFIPDGSGGGFASTTLAADTQVVRSYLLIAEELAEAYVSGPLVQDLACDFGESSCVDTLLQQVGRRAFRRPLTPAERDTLVALHAQILPDDGEALAMQAVVTALLTSPAFLYLEEPVVPTGESTGDLVALEPHALASRLSYFLWSSAPDDELLDAAWGGGLDAVDDIETQVRRMIADDRFDRTLASFHRQWTHVDELDGIEHEDPAWNGSLRQSMLDETMALVHHVFRDGDGRVATLLGADFSFVDADLAALYGVDAPAEPFGRVDWAGTERAGLLTHAGVLTVMGVAFPEVHRGLFVRTQLLCDEVPAPGEDIVLDPEVPRLETQPCAACHALMDTIGVGFANYDSLGRYRTEDAAGAPIDATGDVLGHAGDPVGGPFESVKELVDRLSVSPTVERCVATQWARYATGRHEGEADECAIDSLAERFSANGGDLRELVVDVAMTEWFRSRSASEL